MLHTKNYNVTFLCDGLNGPKISTGALLKAPSTGKGNNGLKSFDEFFMAQSTHDLHHSSTRLMKSFAHTKMGTGDIIMHIR